MHASQWTVVQKWLLVQSMPVILLCTIGSTAFVTTAYRWFLLQKQRRQNQWGIAMRHLTGINSSASLNDTLFGVFFAGLYYVYFAVLRNGMAIYNCKLGKSGKLTMASEPSVLCSVADPVYATLQPLSVLSICIYGIGIPLMFMIVLAVYRVEIRADQKLRAIGLGDVAGENLQLFVRKRYQKLYNDFQPDFYYWRLVLMARKFLLVQCSTFFSRDAMLQASISVCIMFFCYVIQAAYRPFLRRMPSSAKELEAVVGEVGTEKAKKLSYVFDYNTLENALLITSSMTLMGGMVFSSASLEVSNESPAFVALSAVIVIMLGVAIGGFVIMLGREIVRSFQFALITAAMEDRRARTIKITKNARYVGAPLTLTPSTLVPRDDVRLSEKGAVERGQRKSFAASLSFRIGRGQPPRSAVLEDAAPMSSNPLFRPRPAR